MNEFLQNAWFYLWLTVGILVLSVAVTAFMGRRDTPVSGNQGLTILFLGPILASISMAVFLEMIFPAPTSTLGWVGQIVVAVVTAAVGAIANLFAIGVFTPIADYEDEY